MPDSPLTRGSILKLLEQAIADGWSKEVIVHLQWFLHFAEHRSVSKTCRHFKIARSTFYRWLKRFDENDLHSLEDQPTLSGPKIREKFVPESMHMQKVQQREEKHCSFCRIVTSLRRYARLFGVSLILISIFFNLAFLLFVILPGKAEASTWDPTVLVNTESFQIVDEGDASTDIELRFGDALDERLIWDRTNSRFRITDDLFVEGALSGASLRVSGPADIHGALSASGNIVTDADITLNADNGAVDAVLTFGGTSPKTLTYSDGSTRFAFDDEVNVTKSTDVTNEAGISIDFTQQDDVTASESNYGVLVNMVSQSNDVDLLYGLYINGITAQANPIETAINVASGWDSAISTSDGTVTLNEAGDANSDVRMEGNNQDYLFFLDASTDRIGINSASPETAFAMSGTLTVSGAAVFNEYASPGNDFRIEGVSDANLFFADASTNRVGIGESSPDAKLSVVGAISGSQITVMSGATSYILGNTAIGATGSEGRMLAVSANSSVTSLTANNLPALALVNTNITDNTYTDISFIMEDDLGDRFIGSRIAAVVTNHTMAETATDLVFLTDEAGTLAEHMRINSDGNVGIGSKTPETALAMSGTLTVSGAAVFNEYASPGNDFRIEGVSDTNLFFLDASTDRVGIGTATPDAKFEVQGAISGTTLLANTVLASSGNLIVDGNTILNGTLSGASSVTLSNFSSCTALETDAQGVLTCGTDDTGGSGSFGTGNVITIGDSRYVNLSGDTMTGDLILDASTLTATGGIFTGTLSASGAVSFESTLSINDVQYTFPGSDGVSSGNVLTTDSSGQLSWATDQNTGGTDWSGTGALQTAFDDRYVNQSGDTMTGNLILDASTLTATGGIFTGTLSASGAVSFESTLSINDDLSVIGTISGSALRVDGNADIWGNLTASGSITTEGTISGATIANVTHSSTFIDADTNTLHLSGALIWYVDGDLTTGSGKSMKFTLPVAFEPTEVEVAVDDGGGPSGTALIIDIEEDDLTIFSTDPQIAAGAEVDDGNHVISDTSLAAGSEITLEIRQIGSTKAGSGLTVQLHGSYDM